MASITTAISGKAGTVSGTPGTGDVGSEITEWNIEDTIEDLDATSMDSLGFYDNAEGIKKATGSFTAIAAGSEPASGTVTTAVFAVGSTTGDLTYTGDILITSVSAAVAAQGSVVTWSGNFVFRGSYARGTVV